MRISDWSSDVCSSDLPAADLFEKLGALMPEFADDEPAHCHAAGQNGAERRGEEMRLLRRGQPIILRDESANRNARELVEEREHGLPYRAADQFEIDVDTIGAGGRDRKSTRLKYSH